MRRLKRDMKRDKYLSAEPVEWQRQRRSFYPRQDETPSANEAFGWCPESNHRQK